MCPQKIDKTPLSISTETNTWRASQVNMSNASEWRWHQVGHGKGSHDGFGGRIKCLADEAVKQNPENMVQDKSDYVKWAKKQEGSRHITYIKYPTQFIADEGLELERMPCITIPGTMNRWTLITLCARHKLFLARMHALRWVIHWRMPWMGKERNNESDYL